METALIDTWENKKKNKKLKQNKVLESVVR